MSWDRPEIFLPQATTCSKTTQAQTWRTEKDGEQSEGCCCLASLSPCFVLSTEIVAWPSHCLWLFSSLDPRLIMVLFWQLLTVRLEGRMVGSGLLDVSRSCCPVAYKPRPVWRYKVRLTSGRCLDTAMQKAWEDDTRKEEARRVVESCQIPVVI